MKRPHHPGHGRTRDLRRRHRPRRQRSRSAGIAAALLGDPHTVILDEPVNGLDVEGIRWIRTLLKELYPAVILTLAAYRMRHRDA